MTQSSHTIYCKQVNQVWNGHSIVLHQESKKQPSGDSKFEDFLEFHPTIAPKYPQHLNPFQVKSCAFNN